MTPKPRPPLPPGPYLVVGLARSGVAAALALRTRGLTVTGVDAGNAEDPALAKAAGRLRAAGVEVRLDASGVDLAARARTLIKSPGVPQDARAITAARSRGLTVLGELEFAWRLIPNEFVAVTGTNGKTTTTEWIGHVHREAGLPVAVAGNVGTAASSLIGRLDDDVTVVCEASSFQLEDSVAFSPEAAVLLNLSPDHLDRHGTCQAYVAAKLRIDHGVIDDIIVVAAALARLHEGRGIEMRDPERFQIRDDRSGSVEIEIADTGGGIAREHIHRIFDPFFTTKASGRGTGLGLSVSYGIIKEHAGKIDVRSTPGKGTSFHVEFPAAVKKAVHA